MTSFKKSIDSKNFQLDFVAPAAPDLGFLLYIFVKYSRRSVQLDLATDSEQVGFMHNA